jgi:hypothetical protein
MVANEFWRLLRVFADCYYDYIHGKFRFMSRQVRSSYNEYSEAGQDEFIVPAGAE